MTDAEYADMLADVYATVCRDNDMCVFLPSPEARILAKHRPDVKINYLSDGARPMPGLNARLEM